MNKYRIKPLIRPSEFKEDTIVSFSPIEVQGITQFEKPEHIHEVKIGKLPPVINEEGEEVQDETEYNLIDIYVKYKSRADIPSDYQEYKDRPELFDEEAEPIQIIGLDEIPDTRLEDCLSQRGAAYRQESDPLFIEAMYDEDEKKKELWREKVAEIKERFPKPKV